MKKSNLTTGSKSRRVHILQDLLTREGYSIPKRELDRNYFGKGTKRALMLWQRKQGLKPSGEVDAATSAILIAKNVFDSQPSTKTTMKKKKSTPKNTIREKAQTNEKMSPATIETLLNNRENKRLNVLSASVSPRQQKRLEKLFQETKGEFFTFKKCLSEDKYFSTETVKKVLFSYELSDLFDDEETLVNAFLSNDRTNSLKEIALSTKKADFKSYIHLSKIPSDIEGETDEERIEKYADRLNDRLFHLEPVGVLHRMIRDSEIKETICTRPDLLTFFESQPELDFRKTSILKTLQDPDSLKSIPEENQQAVINQLKKLQRLSSVSFKAEAIPVLLEKELDSAYKINEIPLERFVARFADELGGEDTARIIHRNAQNITLRNEEAYLALRQATFGANVHMIHGESVIDRRTALEEYARDKDLPINFETLFGSVDLCECDHCNSVYSPAAYLVELFQYLRNNNLDPDDDDTGDLGIAGTPLKKLFKRRPDLGHLQLTCENTNTLIPYVDLVNEVMESFVINLNDYEEDTHDPKQATIRTHNVEGESSGELLAEPQHIKYRAYRKLRKAVYPASQLPYHQPIDTIRHYLDYLNSSRHELMDTFRSSITFPLPENPSISEQTRASAWENQKKLAVDRAVAAEYLNITQEEYVILTKEGFHSKEWYELDADSTLTQAAYHEEIGLLETWNYFGVEDENQLLEELKWVKPPQETGMIGFLRRTSIQYTDLIDLLHTRYINPNYLSGKALAYMSSLKFSYRFLQSLVDTTQADTTLRYQQLVQFLISDLNENLPSPFTAQYVACWVHRYFEKIGKLIVLEDSTSCACLQGRLTLHRIRIGSDTARSIQLQMNQDCQITQAGSNNEIVGTLDTSNGRLNFNKDFLQGWSLLGADFMSYSGEIGRAGQDLILHINDQPFICANYQEKCDLSNTQLKHLDGTDLETSEYDRMHCFIRLQSKLKWEVFEVDQAITGIGEAAISPLPTPGNFLITNDFVTLLPSDDSTEIDDFTTPSTNTGVIGDFTIAPSDGDSPIGSDDLVSNPIDLSNCLPEPISHIEQEITPYLIEQLAAIRQLRETTGLELPQLLAYWTNIGTYGEKSLYQRLFLKYNLVALDDIFIEDEFGIYLGSEGESISDHIPILMSALRVSADTIETIMNVASIEDEMTLENISAIYRYTLLLKSLRLSTTELSGLLSLTQNLAFPFENPVQSVEFYQLATRIDNSGFDIASLNYMLMGMDNEARPVEPGTASIFQLAIQLRNDLLKIEHDHQNVILPEEATEELLRNKLGLLYDAETTEGIIEFLQGTTIYLDNTRRQFSTQLEAPDIEAISAFLMERQREEEQTPGGLFQNFLARVQFSGARGLQVTGILNEEDWNRVQLLTDEISNADDANNFSIVIQKIQAQPQTFFNDTLSPIFADDIDEANDSLLVEDRLNEDDPDLDSATAKRMFFLNKFMPYLREQLRERSVLQQLTDNTGLDQELIRSLVMDVITSDEDNSLYEEIIRLKEQQEPEGDNSQWQGYFVPEKDGHYQFLLEAEGDSATLNLSNRDLWASPDTVDEEGIHFYSSEKVLLSAGVVYPISLAGFDVTNDGEIIALFMKYEDQAQEEIPSNKLFPNLQTEAFKSAYISLFKAALLMDGFNVQLSELELFLEFAPQFDSIDFNQLTFTHWLRLEAFYRLKNSLPNREITLTEFLRWSHQQDEAFEETEVLIDQIHTLTGWERRNIRKLLLSNHFDLQSPHDFQNEVNLLKLQDALRVAKKVDVGIGYLFQWSKPSSGFFTTKKIAAGIREVIRARYSQEEWEQAIKPVNDQLRENRKQALIAYLLAQPVLLKWGVRNVDNLFEFFLIDVQMDPCMETSRIKQAISSVQLFVQRCFLGLEEEHGVKSNQIDRTRWEWMANYRVWEANRKVYLYPENWVRPELRDDKSPFFQELESELLQNDISKGAVKAALQKYIVQVDEVANLEVLGQFLEGDKETGKLHVIGRTRNAPFFHYYRYYDYSTKYWYPWEKMEVDIPNIDVQDSRGSLVNNGAYAIPAVWKGRLFVFFPEFMEKNWKSELQPQQKVGDGEENKSGDMQPMKYWEIKLGWSERKEGKWTPKQLSNKAVNAMRVIDGHDNPNIEGIQHQFNFYTNPEKFTFVPFVANNGIFVQPYYIGETMNVVENIFNNFTSYNREYNFPQEKIHLSNSFRYDGDQVRIIRAVNDTVHFLWNVPPAFEKLVDGDSHNLFRIQAKGSEFDPLFDIYPAFRNVNRTTNFNGQYDFHHSKTNKLLGYLRKDKLKKVFKEMELNDDNFGSDNGIDYHELKRPYSLYNWEMLFHSVGMLAEQLSNSKRFEESMQWWHYIFDPINVKGDIKNVWKFLPFRATDSRNVLDKLFNDLDPNTPNDKVNEWRENPFMPHVIARDRPASYMKWVVMKYIDNLIAWGDHLFRQDTIESINRATQLYILAGNILGPKPEVIPKRGKVQPKSYRDLVNKWDAFSNAIVDLELLFPFSNQIGSPSVVTDDETHSVNIYGFATTLYFCIPDNPKLRAYWDTVADRLFKIRHCLNIEGVFRKLNLFEPAIDPALLVQAAAQGLSIGSVLNDLNTAMPNYRFNYLLARALEVTSEVKSLGGALLSALEKKDGETLSLLRAKHDANIQNLILTVRELQLEEAESNLKSLEQNRKAPAYRLKHYLQLTGEESGIPAIDTTFTELENTYPELKEESGMKLIASEAEEVKKAKLSRDLQIGVGAIEVLASALHAIPTFEVDVKPLGVGAGMGIGGSHFGSMAQALARSLQIGVNVTSAQSAAASRKTGFIRQAQDRILQANLAGHELMQIDKQITAQKIRIELAKQELENHCIQMEQTQEIETFIQRKFSNEQLYQWMSDQLRDLYYQTYSFAYDMAKKAEKVYRFDMGLPSSDFIKFGYWNSSKEGLLAGEQLYLALKQLENAYIETKPHDYEITKHISLKQLNPLTILFLKEEGTCEFDLPETLFDLDYAGHYKRRIKTVSISIPCISGPYTSLNCTLRLLKHEYRNSKIAANGNDYAKKLEEADERFMYNPIPTTAIAVSQGQNDSGAFELNFNSERYLPFEGAGTISRWRLELPNDFRQFNYDTITDVVMHLSYTSCEGGINLKNAALENLSSYVEDAALLSKQEGLFRMLSLKNEFPNEWHRLMNPTSETAESIFDMGNLRERLPFFANSQKISECRVNSVMLFTSIQGLSISVLKSENPENLNTTDAQFSAEMANGAAIESLQQYVITDQDENLDGYWGLQFDQNQITSAEMTNSWLVVRYELDVE